MFTLKALPFPNYGTGKHDSLNWIPGDKQRDVLHEAQYQCSCCGLKSRSHRDFPSGYMEILEINDDQYVLCSVCIQSQYMGRAVNGKANHGLIIYCPKLSQGQVTKLALWSYIAKLRGNQFSESANKLIGMITKDLIEPVGINIPGFNTGDVKEFVDLYENLSPNLRANETKIFSDLRYWPNEVVFENQVRFWNLASFKGISDELAA